MLTLYLLESQTQNEVFSGLKSSQIKFWNNAESGSDKNVEKVSIWTKSDRIG